MEQPTTTLTQTLEAAFDPFMLIDTRGQILWENHNSRTFFGRSGDGPSTLSDTFGEASAKEILATTRGQSLEVRALAPQLQDIPLACFVLDAASGAPEDGSFLISCKSMVAESARMHQHEEYLAAMAHDLKNPLGALFGYADALLETSISAGLSEKQRTIIERVRTTATRSLELVRNFQQLVLLDHGAVLATGSVVELNSTVKNVIESLWREGSKQTLRLELHSKELSVRIDRFQLERVISNLVTNAIKYSPPNGRVVIQTCSKDGFAQLSVNNSGTVIPQSELTTLFKRYSRASTGTRSTGTGLGLYIVKSILDAVGASISVTSTINDGTTFVVTFAR